MPQLNNQGFAYLTSKGIQLEHFHGSAYDPAKITALIEELLATPPAALAASGGGEPLSDTVLGELVRLEAETKANDPGITGDFEKWAGLQKQFQAACINAAPGLLARLRKAESAASTSIGEVADGGDVRGLNAILNGLANADEWDAEQLDNNVRQLRDFINSKPAAPASPLVERPAGLSLTKDRWVYVAETPELKEQVNALFATIGMAIPADNHGPRYKYVLWNGDKIDALYSDWTKPRWGMTQISYEQLEKMVQDYKAAPTDEAR